MGDAAVSGQPFRHISTPQPGFYTTRLVKGGPVMPVLVYQACPWVQPEISVEPFEWCRPLDRSRSVRIFIPGAPRADIDSLWPYLRPAAKGECLYLIAEAQWQQINRPSLPLGNPYRPVAEADKEYEP